MRGRSIIIAVLALGVAPAVAGASSARNATSTHAYIVANYAFARASVATIAPAQADIVALDQKLGQECPDVGAGSPQDEASQEPSHEVAGALWSVSYGADAGPIHAFVEAVRRLRWSNPEITRIAQNYTRSLEGLAALAVPELCGNMREWSASGFRTVPAATTAFVTHAESLEGHTIPQRLLASYERPADRRIVQRTTQLEARLESNELNVGFDDWDMLLATLGMNQ
jgi:hypothetical protein